MERRFPSQVTGLRDRVNDLQNRVSSLFTGLGVVPRLHVCCVDCGRGAGVDADTPAVLASVVKVPLVLELARQAAAGQLDLAERAVVGAGDRLGGTGTSGCSDDVEMSLRDLARMAMTVSDNAAADVLFRRLGADTVQLLVKELDLTGTRITGGPGHILATVAKDLGSTDPQAFARTFAALPPDRIPDLRALDPERTNSGTARDMTRLLSLIWTDRAGPARACATVRGWMSEQVSWHRLAAAFPADVAVAAKSGTFPGVRNEIGVVTLPTGPRYAAAVLIRTATPDTRRPDLDTAMGGAVREAVAALGGCCTATATERP
ncbi:serine hydrolase [Streptomyces sp. KR80]|uniref:serine hydrolase n=1 Tax=Streptomyces sp. KR80 TaxID=3457426 RepID=UPI003FD61F59